MNHSKASHSSSDLSGGYDETQPPKYPQFDEELWPQRNIPGAQAGVSVVEAISPRYKSGTRSQNKEAPFVPEYPEAEQMDLSFRTSTLSMEPSQNKKEILRESLMESKGIGDNKQYDGIDMATSVEVPQRMIFGKGAEPQVKKKEQVDLKNSADDKIKEDKKEGLKSYNFLDGDISIRPMQKSTQETKGTSPINNTAAVERKRPEIAEIIDTVKYERQVTEHDNFADDNALYHIHDMMTSSRHRSVQTDRKSVRDKKLELAANNAVIRIVDANSVKDGMFSTYVVYKIQTKLQGDNEREITVTRRYRDFDALFEHLSNTYQGHIIPILPPKSIKTTLQIESDEFYKTRKRELGAFLIKCMQHPFLKDTEELEVFLTDQNAFHGIINKKDQSYFSWWNSDLLTNLFSTVSSAVKGENTQTVYREKTSVDNELDNYEMMFGILGRRLQGYSQDMTRYLELKERGIKVTASFALEMESIRIDKEEFQQNKRQVTSAYSKNADVEKGCVTGLLEKTATELKDIINSVESVNVALRKRNNHIRELYRLQEIVEMKSLKAKKNHASNQKLDELKSECSLWKEDLQQLSSTLLEEVISFQTEITENIKAFCQSIYEGNRNCLEQSSELWTVRQQPV